MVKGTHEHARWESPGGKLLRRILPAWRALLPGELADKLDPFVTENFVELTRRLSDWIWEDAARESCRRIADDRLETALRRYRKRRRHTPNAVSELAAVVEPEFGDFWRTIGLLRRAGQFRLPSELLHDAFAHLAASQAGSQHEATLRALKGAASEAPEYRRTGPVDTSTRRGRLTLDRRVVAALDRRSPLIFEQLYADVGGRDVDVFQSLHRLKVKGCVRSEGKQYRLVKDCEAPVDTRSTRGRASFDRHLAEALAAGSPLTADQLEWSVGGTNLQVRTALNRLINKGLVRWERKKRGGTVYYIWRAAEEGGKSRAG